MRNLRHGPILRQSADDDWVAFLRRLAESKNRKASLYGRFGLLNRDFEKHLANVHLREPAESLLAGVEAWLKDYAAIDSESRKSQPETLARTCIIPLIEMRNQLVYELKQPAKVVVRPGPAGRVRRQATRLPTVKSPAGRCQVVVSRKSSCAASSPAASTDCWRLATNAMCCGGTTLMAIVREKGAAVEILPTQTRFHNACWDGRQIWVATTHQGIWVFSTEGAWWPRSVRSRACRPPIERWCFTSWSRATSARQARSASTAGHGARWSS